MERHVNVSSLSHKNVFLVLSVSLLSVVAVRVCA